MYLHRWLAGLAVVVIAALPAQASLYGTMSNFDTFNETPENCYGAEIELEGIHKEDLSRTFPAHFTNESVVDYVDGSVFGTRITYSDYNFNSLGYLEPSVGQSTNGHACVNIGGCEHFGFSTVGMQPTGAKFSGSMPMAIVSAPSRPPFPCQPGTTSPQPEVNRRVWRQRLKSKWNNRSPTRFG